MTCFQPSPGSGSFACLHIHRDACLHIHRDACLYIHRDACLYIHRDACLHIHRDACLHIHRDDREKVNQQCEYWTGRNDRLGSFA